MSIYSRRYTRYDGPTEPFSARFAVIADTEVRRLLSEKWVRRLLLLAWSPVLVLATMLYVGLVMKKATGIDPVSGDVFLYLFRIETWFVAIMMAAFGSALIAKDVAARALSLYFTRPVGVMQYLGGKLGAVIFMVLGVTLLPGLLLAVVQMLMSDPVSFTHFLDMCWRVAVNSSVVAFVSGTAILLLSSLGAAPRYVGLVWLALFFFLDIARSVLIGALGDTPLLDLISVRALFYGATELLFRGESDQAPALAALLLLGAFCFVALRLRIQVLERRAR